MADLAIEIEQVAEANQRRGLAHRGTLSSSSQQCSGATEEQHA